MEPTQAHNQTMDGVDEARLATWLAEADAVLVTAGAGMGVDSGLPDYRGATGFWEAYPALGKRRMSFEEIANAEGFRSHPRLAWGFYGHRIRLYRSTIPHEGFQILRRYAATRPHGGFVFTSNVDGQFQRAGFPDETVCECHGSIHHMQCTADCGQHLWSADEFEPEVDEENCQLIGPLPQCPRCGAMARPAVLLFADYNWDGTRTDHQYRRLRDWLAHAGRVVTIEVGAGRAVPTVRQFSESQPGPLIRINPRDYGLPAGHDGIALRCDGLEGLRLLEGLMPGIRQA